jgi:hypothetical protein
MFELQGDYDEVSPEDKLSVFMQAARHVPKHQ